MNSAFKNLGVGLGLRSAHHSVFLNQAPKTVSWVEVISENYMPWKGHGLGSSFEFLKSVRRNLPVALHGVSLNIGSTDPLDMDYLRRLKVLVDAIEPEIVSDHLSWTGVDGKNTHDLLPLPYTKEALKNVCEKVQRVQDFLGRRIVLENPSSYVEFKSSSYSEAEFISQISETTDCGLLLDINNVYVSSINHGFDPITYLKSIPAHRIAQLHLAGHSNENGFLIDTHDAPVCDEVWKLFDWTLANLGVNSTLLERDGNIPEWNELELEIKKIHEAQNG